MGSRGLAAHIAQVCRREYGPDQAHAKARFYAPLIERAARKYGFDPHLLVALIWHESNFNPNTVSHAGARGLCQVMPGHFRARRLGGGAWRNPAINLDVGCQILRSYYDQVARRYPGLPRQALMHRALVAYNMGPRAVVSRGIFRSRYSGAVLRTAERRP